MPNCVACEDVINQERDGNVCLPCGHTFHPVCYLSSYNDNQDELPNDFIYTNSCAICVLDVKQIINDERTDSIFTEEQRSNYNYRRAQIICAHNKIYIKRTETAESAVSVLEERHKRSLKGFVKVARRYGAARWKLEREIFKKRKAIIEEAQRIVAFTIKRMEDEAYNDITTSELYSNYVKNDKEYVKSLNSLQCIDPIQYFSDSVAWFLTKNMSLNRYTRKLVRDDILAKQFPPPLNRSTIRKCLRIKVT